jgi:hypothetical protein
MSTHSESEGPKKQVERSRAKCNYCRQKKIKVRVHLLKVCASRAMLTITIVCSVREGLVERPEVYPLREGRPAVRSKCPVSPST